MGRNRIRRGRKLLDLKINLSKLIFFHLKKKKLALESKSIYIRFWGKILTKGKDYYVCEGKL